MLSPGFKLKEGSSTERVPEPYAVEARWHTERNLLHREGTLVLQARGFLAPNFYQEFAGYAVRPDRLTGRRRWTNRDNCSGL